MQNELPLIGLTLGDPVGVGPEVVAKTLSSDESDPLARKVVFGSLPILERSLDLVGSKKTPRVVRHPSDPVKPNEIALYQIETVPELGGLSYGNVSAIAGDAAVRWVKEAARCALDGEIDAVATAPINKHAASLAGYSDIGHQEIYQTMTGAEHVVTMLVTTGLRVVHLTTHRALRLACDAVTTDNVLAKLRLTHNFFVSQGYPAPRIAAAALNPHGGEAGIIGSEEIDAIAPAVALANTEGMNVAGPIPADTVFNQAINGDFDAVLAMYHDQGHVAIKVHDWASSATMNLGLPFIRTSVDHGTAFDIAGKGVANPKGMMQALRLAAFIAGSETIRSF